MTALAVAGGEASARQMQVLLGRKSTALSRVRDELINRGEVYSPHSRTVALTMPLMGSYAAAAYPEDRARSSMGDSLVSLEKLQQNQATWNAGSTAALSAPDPRIRLAPAQPTTPGLPARGQARGVDRAGGPGGQQGDTTHERDQR